MGPLVQKIVSIATNNNNKQVERLLKARMGLFRHECYKAVVEHLADTCPQLELRNVRERERERKRERERERDFFAQY